MSNQPNIFDLETGERQATPQDVPEPTPEESPEPSERTGVEEPEDEKPERPANPDPKPSEALFGAARPRINWGSFDADADTWAGLIRRVTGTEEYGYNKTREILTRLQDDLSDTVEAGAVTLCGVPLRPHQETRTLSDLKDSALGYLEDTREHVSESAAQAFQATVSEAEQPGPVIAAGRQLRKMVTASRTGSL